MTKSTSSEMDLIAANSILLLCATAATAAASISTTSAFQRLASARFCSGPLTDDAVKITDSPSAYFAGSVRSQAAIISSAFESLKTPK